MSYIYLASPYTHQDPNVLKIREKQISEIGYVLMKHGYNLFCPITQSHRLADVAHVVLGHEECMRVDLAFLEKADELFVVKLHGWDESRGVREEIQFAKQHGIPITYINGTDWKIDGALSEGLTCGGLKLLDSENPKVDVISMNDRLRSNLDSIYVEDRRKGKIIKPTHIIPGVKDAVNKAELRHIPYAAAEAIARGRAYGNNKYKDPSKWYSHPEALNDFVEAAQRHIGKYFDAILYNNRSVMDEESGLHHLDHAITTLALAIALRDKPENRENHLEDTLVGEEQLTKDFDVCVGDGLKEYVDQMEFSLEETLVRREHVGAYWDDAPSKITKVSQDEFDRIREAAENGGLISNSGGFDGETA